MFGRLNIGARRCGAKFRGFSSESEPSGFQKALDSLSRNKQAVVNTIGVYIVLSYSVHNYRVQQAWDQREEEHKAMEEEVERMKSTLLSSEWIEATENAIKASGRFKKGVLGTEIDKVLKLRSDAEKVGYKQKAIQKNSSASDMGGLEQLASLVDGGSADKAKASDKNGVDIKIV
jgi:hypothetical protein